MGVFRDCPIFLVFPIISGTGKATNFSFCTHILSIDRNKSLLQISGKVARCVVRTLKTFQGTHIFGASRGLLCDSSAVLYIRCVVSNRIGIQFHRNVPRINKFASDFRFDVTEDGGDVVMSRRKLLPSGVCTRNVSRASAARSVGVHRLLATNSLHSS